MTADSRRGQTEIEIVAPSGQVLLSDSIGEADPTISADGSLLILETDEALRVVGVSDGSSLFRRTVSRHDRSFIAGDGVVAVLVEDPDEGSEVTFIQSDGSVSTEAHDNPRTAVAVGRSGEGFAILTDDRGESVVLATDAYGDLNEVYSGGTIQAAGVLDGRLVTVEDDGDEQLVSMVSNDGFIDLMATSADVEALVVANMVVILEQFGSDDVSATIFSSFLEELAETDGWEDVVVLTVDEQTVVLVGYDGGDEIPILLDVESGALIELDEFDDVTGADMDSRYIYIGEGSDRDGATYVYDRKTGEPVDAEYDGLLPEGGGTRSSMILIGG